MRGKWRNSNIHQGQPRDRCGLCILNTEENSIAISFSISLFISPCGMFIRNLLFLSIMVLYQAQGAEYFIPHSQTIESNLTPEGAQKSEL